MDKIERLINLTAYLLESNRAVSFERLCQTVYAEYLRRDKPGNLDAVKRMFERDRDELGDIGIVIKTEKDAETGEVSYIISKDEYYLPNIELEPEERIGIAMLSSLFRGSGAPFEEPAHSALLKLGFDQGDFLKGERIPRIHMVTAPGEREALKEIFLALTQRKNITFFYRRLGSEEKSKRKVSPYGLIYRKGCWYLVGFCHQRGEVRSFKVRRMIPPIRIERASSRKPDFEVPREFDLHKESSWAFLDSENVESHHAVVRFDEGLPFTSFQSLFTVVSVRDEGGKSVVTYSVRDMDEFADWILDFGARARVLNPPELTRRVVQRLKGIIEVVGG
ncbi:MAG: WYL domain-containing protein [Actinomycetota bacterium]|nr:WYL domain-containing protein [Actinomycetota bacterium]